MKKQRHDFVHSNNDLREDWYDLREDWELIEASLAKQYGIRIRQQSDMPWTEFSTLVAGIMPNTPLGQIVNIRSETNPKIIQNFTPEQRKIYTDWRDKRVKRQLENPKQLEYVMSNLEKTLEKMFGDNVKQ